MLLETLQVRPLEGNALILAIISFLFWAFLLSINSRSIYLEHPSKIVCNDSTGVDLKLFQNKQLYANKVHV